jgi:transcriptional regulator with XRE-family HTH domain
MGERALARNSSEFDVGARLAAIRAGREISQGTASRRAGLTPAYLSRIENGRVQPSFAMVLRILTALHADLTDLAAPEALHEGHSAACPVSAQGKCLLELIRSQADVARADGREAYSPRELRLLQDLARLVRKGSPERVHAIELILQEFQAGRT